MSHSTNSLFNIAFPDAPNLAFERTVEQNLTGKFAGIDEAGRGPWAGPVVIAAAILDYDNLPVGLNDSKKLTEHKREELFEQILDSAEVSICVQSAKTIDRINIREATLQGMRACARGLTSPVKRFFIDGRDVPPHLPYEGQALIKGDGRCLAISAASIVAKVTRDRLMVKMDQHFPEYGFAKHKGYGTKVHQEALATHGVTPLHRCSFRPIRERIEAG
ncbi:ribonuclease HII [Pseudovibrio sp. Tun.PSC04-5.I4]|uniref:ribonuclease HII n=1 Tax=Pseudovibrio sp. Tun.PSC04-5.I4 TaxID=1798213 RepID=UPI000885EC67|nr:ribonuclease HII [Pseudovibrio sp. Tun.PSC04-5.I4]SDQ80867.1 RNase HII [Pseudovibrio sp. Tun.PSC04-5.I4]